VSDRGYLSIGEVLSLLQDEFPDVTISKIRFLESQGLIDPERTPSGYRKFYPADIERLRFILREQKDNFLPLKVIKDRLDDTEEPAPEAPERVPAWMQDKSRSAAAAELPGVSFTIEELAAASGLPPAAITELEHFGLIIARKVGPSSYYDEQALTVARLAAGFYRHGIEARHLRMYRSIADRESSLFEQVILPLVKQRNPRAREEAGAALSELTRLGHEMRAVVLREALRSYTDGV
jgi:DNA-binding transcriptional MerR regulator